MCKDCGCQEGHECGCSCGCECHGHVGHFERRYQTKAEQIAELETYLSELKTEVQAVEERLTDLRK
jgi:predicted phage gp36 major capsid-like protein